MLGYSIPLQFYGYFREVNVRWMLQDSGVYCVYACRNQPGDNTVWLRKLLYIGESGNVYVRLANHDRRVDWRRHLLAGEELCYTFAPVWYAIREQVEAALIFHHKPPENTEFVHSFPYQPIQITTIGQSFLLSPEFTAAESSYGSGYGQALELTSSPLLAAVNSYGFYR